MARKHRKLSPWVLIFAAIITLTSAVLFATFWYIDKHTVKYTLSQKETVLSVKKGDLFKVELPSNNTTGYSWKTVPTYDPKIVGPQGNKYISSRSTQVGSSGTQIITFKALSKGTTSLTFKYIQPWEKDSSPAKVQTFSVSVR